MKAIQITWLILEILMYAGIAGFIVRRWKR